VNVYRNKVVFLCEWETLFPLCNLLPVISQIRDILLYDFFLVYSFSFRLQNK
jgi:hypothetical protein